MYTNCVGVILQSFGILTIRLRLSSLTMILIVRQTSLHMAYSRLSRLHECWQSFIKALNAQPSRLRYQEPQLFNTASHLLKVRPSFTSTGLIDHTGRDTRHHV
jgi:hypothetical protein